jgi:hypothetical protein
MSVRLTDAQREQLADLARQRHIGASTLAALIVGDWLAALADAIDVLAGKPA